MTSGCSIQTELSNQFLKYSQYEVDRLLESPCERKNNSMSTVSIGFWKKKSSNINHYGCFPKILTFLASVWPDRNEKACPSG